MELKAGFARLDITPPLGLTLAGYFRVRVSDDILDPLKVTAVVFDDGSRKGALIGVDIIGIVRSKSIKIRQRVADALKTDVNAVFISCTHTHLAPGVNTDEAPEYLEWLTGKIVDAAVFANRDLKPVSKMLYTQTELKDTAFVRRYYMKDGTVVTNPGFLNPDIEKPVSKPDEQATLVLFRREGADEIALISFGIHADCIGGNAISADFPKFVRDTYEAVIPDSKCLFITGTQGDINNINVKLSREEGRGYHTARHVGRRIAMSVLANYEYLKELETGDIRYGEKCITVKHRKGTPEQVRVANEAYRLYIEQNRDVAMEYAKECGMPMPIAMIVRIHRLDGLPDEKELNVTALAVGNVVFAGFPGEPFTSIGLETKAGSKYKVTLPLCCSNGYEGYFPSNETYEQGGYEAASARYEQGTAERLSAASVELINSL